MLPFQFAVWLFSYPAFPSFVCAHLTPSHGASCGPHLPAIRAEVVQEQAPGWCIPFRGDLCLTSLLVPPLWLVFLPFSTHSPPPSLSSPSLPLFHTPAAAEEVPALPAVSALPEVISPVSEAVVVSTKSEVAARLATTIAAEAAAAEAEVATISAAAAIATAAPATEAASPCHATGENRVVGCGERECPEREDAHCDGCTHCTDMFVWTQQRPPLQPLPHLLRLPSLSSPAAVTCQGLRPTFLDSPLRCCFSAGSAHAGGTSCKVLTTAAMIFAARVSSRSAVTPSGCGVAWRSDARVLPHTSHASLPALAPFVLSSSLFSNPPTAPIGRTTLMASSRSRQPSRSVLGLSDVRISSGVLSPKSFSRIERAPPHVRARPCSPSFGTSFNTNGWFKHALCDKPNHWTSVPPSSSPPFHSPLLILSFSSDSLPSLALVRLNAAMCTLPRKMSLRRTETTLNAVSTAAQIRTLRVTATCWGLRARSLCG